MVNRPSRPVSSVGSGEGSSDGTGLGLGWGKATGSATATATAKATDWDWRPRHPAPVRPAGRGGSDAGHDKDADERDGDEAAWCAGEAGADPLHGGQRPTASASAAATSPERTSRPWTSPDRSTGSGSPGADGEGDAAGPAAVA